MIVTMFRAFNFSLIAIAIIDVATPVSAFAQDGSLPSIAEIEQAWREREARIATLECEWTEEVFIPAESHSAQHFPSLREVLVPKQDLRFTKQCLIKMGGAGRFRYESYGKHLVNRIQKYTDQQTVFVTDGNNRARSYYGEDESGQQRYAPLGFIRKDERIFEMGDLATAGGVLIYCRPSAPEVSPYTSLSDARIMGRESVNGRECVVVKHGKLPRVTQIYFDLERDFVPIRLIRWTGSQNSRQKHEMFRFEFEYRESPNEEVQLSGWKLESFRSENELIVHEIANFSRFEVNATIDESAFQFQFPPGTKVRDEGLGETYILRQNGSKRPVTQAEKDSLVSYKTLLNTEPQLFPLEDENRRVWWRSLVILSLVAIVWVYWYYRNKIRLTE